MDNVVVGTHAGDNIKDNDINMVNYVEHNIAASPLNMPGDIVNGEYLKK